MENLPPYRRLRTYTFDPSLDTTLETRLINQTVLHIPWEKQLGKGPVGEYCEVVDYDPASECFYAPVNLNDPVLLAQDGHAPSEGNPQFHQQMVYAVAMTTIHNFERALGRKALWARHYKRDAKTGEVMSAEPVLRLRLYPHALREANAYYSPERKALLFGYFPAVLANSGENLPGGLVFTCLSHDVIAHETTHALLDGLHRYFAEPSNPDVLAFHEAFADIVALFQHFAQPEALRDQIARTRGDLRSQNLLGKLAYQYGQAIGNHGALRDAIGRIDEKGEWKPQEPEPEKFASTLEPHARGAILVAAMFDAFLSIYRSRIADLLRIATGGTGRLPKGNLHPDLVNRLAIEASKTSRHILRMAIRALDYCPPVDITFGEYLRALVTADWDLVPDDVRDYRIAVIEAFRRRGIYPRDVRTLAADALRWQEPVQELLDFSALLRELKAGSRTLEWQTAGARDDIDKLNGHYAAATQVWIKEQLTGPGTDRERSRNIAWALGLALDEGAPGSVYRGRDGLPSLEVHSVRSARRTGVNGRTIVDLVVELVQRRRGYLDPKKQEEVDDRWRGLRADSDKWKNDLKEDFKVRGGCTLLIDSETGFVRYTVVKNVCSKMRLGRQREFVESGGSLQMAGPMYPLMGRNSLSEPFAMLHRSR